MPVSIDHNMTEFNFQETTKEALGKWYVLLVLAGVVYYALSVVRYNVLKRKLNAKEAPLLPGSGWFFSRPWKMMLDCKRDGTLLPMIWGFFESYGPNWNIYISGMTLFVTADPDNIKAVLATQFNDFALGDRHAHFLPLLGDGIFTLDGQGWKHSRALLRPNFSREKVAHIVSLEDHLQTLAKHFRSYNGKPFDIQEYFFRLTVDTATEFLFGESLYGLRDERVGMSSVVDFEGKSEFYDAFNTSQSYLASRSWSQALYFVIDNFEFRRCNKVVHTFAKYYVNKALLATPEEIEERSKGGYCFLYELVKTTRDPKLLQDQLLNIMIAGRDTTAGLLSFTFYELSRNPDVWKRLRQEVLTAFGEGSESDIQAITFESLKKCDYLKWVINETLRLYPNVPINFRVATKNTTLPRGGGPSGEEPVFIPKGRAVGYVISATHRNPQYYGKDANVFKPERWGDKNLKPGWAYLPFNGGPRICLGQQFALTEASYIIARLCQMFPNLENHDTTGQYPPRMNEQLTLSLTDGAHIALY